MPDWFQTVLAALNSNKLSFSSAVIIVAIALLRVLSMYFEGCAKVLERYADYFWLIFVFCLAVLIVQFALYVKNRVCNHFRQKRERKLAEEKQREQEQQLVDAFFFDLTREEQSILLQMFYKNETTKYLNIEDGPVIKLIRLEYLETMGPTKLSQWHDHILALVSFSRMTTSLMKKHGEEIRKRFNDGADLLEN